MPQHFLYRASAATCTFESAAVGNSINMVLDAIMEPKLVQLYNFQNAIVSVRLLLKFEIDLESTFIPNCLLGGAIHSYSMKFPIVRFYFNNNNVLQVINRRVN